MGVSQSRPAAVGTAGPGELSALTDRVMPRCRAELERLVAIPSVAAVDPAAVDASAEAVAGLFRSVPGVDVDVVSAAGGAPAVLARRQGAPGAPTVLLYAHHDVQPPGEVAGWSSPPFVATERGGRLYGRGVADDKAGVVAHLAAMLVHTARHAPGEGAGVVVMVEGEEEIGSPTLGAFLDAHAAALRSDVLVVADSANPAVGVPGLTTTLRGNVTVEVSVRALAAPVHSGIFGGAVPDPVAALLVAVGGLWDEAGAVRVPGLPGASDRAERAFAAQRDWPGEQFAAEAGVLAGTGTVLPGADGVSRRVWMEPSLTVIGIDAPPVAGSFNVVQAAARARLSLRTPPGADPAVATAALADHVTARLPWGLSAEITVLEEAAGYAADVTGAGYAAARRALAGAWGVQPVDTGMGGSVPFIADLAARMPGTEVLVTGVEDPASRVHSTDESLHLGEWRRACLAEAMLLEELAVMAGD